VGLNNESISGDSATRTASVGDVLTYKIFSESHKDVIFNNYDAPDADNDDSTAKERCRFCGLPAKNLGMMV